MKPGKTAILVSICLAAAFSMQGCGQEDIETGDAYTLNEMLAEYPSDWNPHTTQSSVFSGLCDMGLVDISVLQDSYQWCYEMATDITDVTASFAYKERYGITEESGRVFQITLNEHACWEDGAAINADTYLYSMQQLLNPEMDNSTAILYTKGSTAIYLADEYMTGGSNGQAVYVPLTEGNGYTSDSIDEVYLSLMERNTFYGASLRDAYYGKFTDDFIDGEADLYQELLALMEDETMVVPVTQEIQAILEHLAICAGDRSPDAWLEFCFEKSEKTEEAVSWNDIGLIKTNEYQFLYITREKVSEFDFLLHCRRNWIVREYLYENGKTEEAGKTVTDYGTSPETYQSYGPYRIEAGETLTLVQNANWYGWTEGHEGQYQATEIVFHQYSGYESAVRAFEEGSLDVLAVTDQLELNTERILTKPQSEVERFVFATDLDVLTKLENEAEDGANKRVLAYQDFRKALSLSLDRAALCEAMDPDALPALGLYSNQYFCNFTQDAFLRYRDTKSARKAILELYGASWEDDTMDMAYNTLTGTDPETAKALFQQVYEQAIEDGRYVEGQEIHINCAIAFANEVPEERKAQQELLNSMIQKTTEGTGFEGKIRINYISTVENKELACARGQIEMISTAWSGYNLDPYRLILCYTDPDAVGGIVNIVESCGWDPSIEELRISYDFEGSGNKQEKTDTFRRWALSLNTEDYDMDTRLHILSSLEKGILSAYQCIPYMEETVSYAYSGKIAFEHDNYDILCGFGGVRNLQFLYTDKEWDAICEADGK